MSDALPLAPSAADNDSKLTSLPSSLVSPTDFECSPSPMQRATDVQLEIEPAPTSPDIQSSFPASPSDLESARSATDDQLEPVSLSSVTPPPPTPFHTPSLAPLAAEVPEIAPVSSAEPPANLAPLPSAFPVLPASSDLPSATLSPSLMLGELELESTPASTIVNSDTVPLSSPERPPSPINSTVLTPPGLLKLSPKGPITPPSPSPLEFTSRRSPEVMSIGSNSFSLEVTPSLASSAIPVVPQSQELSMVYEVSLAVAPRLTSFSPLDLLSVSIVLIRVSLFASLYPFTLLLCSHLLLCLGSYCPACI
ncbi:hypothetical protein EDB83DRAFT_2458490 [Lactarius deliciosus]|nr:hypothetical protein EDB83DRAFT_2458490 [Lactarius deliciosus]